MSAHSTSSGVAVPAALSALVDAVERRAGSPRARRVHRAVSRLFTEAMRRTSDITGQDTIAVITGDIPAMWLRDSAWQLRPLLAATADDDVYSVIASVSRQQAFYVLIDPYANAFNIGPTGDCWHKDFSDQSPWVFERKYELDSLTSVLDLALRLYRASGRGDHLDAQFFAAASMAMDVIEREQQHDPATYRFRRRTSPAHDQLSHDGHGAPVAPTGMSWSGFRPSDDGCVYGYLIPSNAHACVVLNQLAHLPATTGATDDLKRRALDLSKSIMNGIEEFGLIRRSDGDYFAYEVDGLGNQLFMDDANVPSLLSLPYLGWCNEGDSRYLATRARVLSAANPHFYVGTAGAGVGSPHTPTQHIWPIAIAVAALTDQDPAACTNALTLLEATDVGTGDMHESFHCDNPAKFTRPWFSWADMMYVHLVLRSLNLSFD